MAMLDSIRTKFFLIIVICTFASLGYHVMNTSEMIQVLHLPRKSMEIKRQNESNILRDIPCLDRKAAFYGRVEDIFCMNRCQLLPHLKNPCFYDYLEKGKKKLQCIPYFYILGAEKAGSTDLFNRLILHPQIIPNKGGAQKETYFWSWTRFGVYLKSRNSKNKTIDTFLEMFSDTASILEKNKASKVITGDASPMDLYDFRTWRAIPQNKGRDEPLVLTPSIIKHFHNGHIPKFIVTLRDPVERSFSNYVHKGNPPELFHHGVVQSLHEIEMCIKQHDMKYCFFDDDLYHRLEVQIQQSCYAVFIPEWFKVFPRSSFFFTSLEDRSVNMRETYTKLFQFLEIDQLSERQMLEIEKKRISNIGSRKVGKKVLPETVSLLRNFYKVCNAGLAEMLQDDRFNWD